MIEDVEAAAKISRKQFREQEPGLRVDLLNLQFDLRKADFSVIVVLSGDDKPACDEVVDLLHEWMDAREMSTQVFIEPTEEEGKHPRFRRYWRDLPRRGQIGLNLGGWTTDAIAERARGELDARAFERRLADVAAFERTLVDDGTLLIKFWFHLSRKKQKKRLEKARRDPGEELYVDEAAWRVYEKYEKVLPIAEDALSKTHTPFAPWVVVDGGDREHRDLTVARALLDTVGRRLDDGSPTPSISEAEPSKKPAATLDEVDLESKLTREEYRSRLEKAQARLSRLTREARRAESSSVLVFEGWDAAGKGGCIRRLTAAIAARDHRVVSIAAPNDEEKARHYLWRFWQRLPRAGQVVLFDRSWYGRVLVERVEEFAREDEWRRAYREINEFEDQLARGGAPVLKFWLHIRPDVQLARFRAREATPYKKYKITDEDYRNRDKWNDYALAVDEMVARTSTAHAPWHLVPANDKRFARVTILETVCRAVEDSL